MLSVSPVRKVAYCETFLPSFTTRRLDELLFTRMLLQHRIIEPDRFFLYKNGESEIQLVGDPFAWLTVDLETVSSQLSDTEQVCREKLEADPFKQIERLLLSLPIASPRAYGYVSFDIVRSYFSYGEKKEFDTPLLCFIVPKVEIRLSERGICIRCIDAQVVRQIATLWEDTFHQESFPPPAATRLAPTMEDRAWYEQGVRTLTADIRANIAGCGPFQKAIFARSVEVPGPLDLLGTYGCIQREPSARSYCFRLRNDAAVGLSPETLLEADAHGSIKTHPLAGTRWRGRTDQEDAYLNEQLQTSYKQQVEHLLSVIAVQREMESVCLGETVCIHGLAHVQRYRTVQHLATRLVGQLAPGRTTWDGLRAVFPGVTVSGVGKEAAIAWIDRLEQRPRGLYAGAIGWIDSDGSADLAIAIRTVFQRGSRVFFWAGAGIVADSDPADEYEETWHKMRAIWPYFVRLTPSEQ